MVGFGCHPHHCPLVPGDHHTSSASPLSAARHHHYHPSAAATRSHGQAALVGMAGWALPAHHPHQCPFAHDVPPPPPMYILLGVFNRGLCTVLLLSCFHSMTHRTPPPLHPHQPLPPEARATQGQAAVVEISGWALPAHHPHQCPFAHDLPPPPPPPPPLLAARHHHSTPISRRHLKPWPSGTGGDSGLGPPSPPSPPLPLRS